MKLFKGWGIVLRIRNLFHPNSLTLKSRPNNFFWFLVYVAEFSPSRPLTGIHFHHHGNSEGCTSFKVTLGLFEFQEKKHNKYSHTGKDTRNVQTKQTLNSLKNVGVVSNINKILVIVNVMEKLHHSECSV